MTTLTLPPTRDESMLRRLRAEVGRSATRGRLIASIGGLLLSAAVFILGLFLIVVVDACWLLTGTMRLVLLLVLLALVASIGLWLIARPWLHRGVQLAAAERVERAAGASDQPVVRGLTMQHAGGPDPLALALQQRAEEHAVQWATRVEPHRAYPASSLGRQGRWLWLALIGWIVMAVVFPGQLLNVFARALTPLSETAPFSLTELDPSWSPDPVKQGDDVTVSVTPEGLQPERVDFVRVDEQGNEIERFEMLPDGAGGFSHPLSQIDQPIRFKLEANGRATRTYTIDPEPRPENAGNEPAQPPNDNPRDDLSGSTQFDPDAVAQRDNPSNAALAGLMQNISQLLADLEQAEADARSVDPADAEALRQLADRLSELAARAVELGQQLDGLRADLPPDAAAKLAGLQRALSQTASGNLPAPPSGQPGGGNSTDQQQQQQANNWLDRAAQAASDDQSQIAQGIGRSDTPTASGTTSGEPGEAPVFNDPRAGGAYDESGVRGDDGPLPDAVMRQVPPTYRDHVAAYFEAAAKPAPQQDNQP